MTYLFSRSLFALTVTGGVLAATTATTAGAVPTARPAADPPGQRVLATDVGAPFQIARRGKTVFYADGGTGKIMKVTKRGPRVVRSVPNVAGVEFSRNKTVMAVAHGGGGPATPSARVTLLRRGKAPVVAQVGAYEQRVNPDRNVTYGILGSASATCRAQIQSETGAPATYRGIEDAHPYQLAALPGGAFALAESGGNGIFRIGPRGRVSTIALLSRQPITLTAAQAEAVGAPACAGVTYAFEPVPTDVERVGKSLWVTTLPGGPESPALGARGSVYRIKNGVVTRMATGFLGATNLAAVRGRVYVTEFFSGRITKFGTGGRFTRYTMPGAVSVEATRKHLYVGTMGMGPSAPGKVVRLRR